MKSKRGVLIREGWLPYGDHKEYICLKEIMKAFEEKKELPIVLKHGDIIPKDSETVGIFKNAVIENNELVGDFEYNDDIDDSAELAVSLARYRTLDENNVQRNIILGHVAIGVDNPRCELPFCGVGVMDEKDPKEEIKEEVKITEEIKEDPKKDENIDYYKKIAEKAIEDKRKSLIKLGIITQDDKSSYEVLKALEQGYNAAPKQKGGSFPLPSGEMPQAVKIDYFKNNPYRKK